MKKSTLITTIAMIVVVVVALSTATYAWFAGATTNQTEQSMTTTAGTGWYLYGGNVVVPESTSGYQGEASITYSQTSPISLNLMNSGLYAPAAILANNLTNSSDLAATYTDTQFFSAKQKGYGVIDNAEITSGVSYSHKVGSMSAQETAPNLNAIRIFNGNEAATSDCHLTILVYTSSNPSDRELLAGKGFTMFIATSDQTSFTTGYWYATELGSDGEAGAAATKTSSSSVAKSNVTYKGASDADSNTYKTIATGYQGTFGNITLPAGTQYYTIDIVLKSGMARDSALNIVFYAWFDGWALDSMAEGGTININLAFDGAEKAVAVAAV